jgi:germination protein M
MLKRKALRKILITTMSVFIFLVIYLFPKENLIKRATNYRIEYVNNFNTSSIYLLDKNNYLVKEKILITSNQLLDKARELVGYLIINKKNQLLNNLGAIIPKGTTLNNAYIENKCITLDFSDSLLNVDKRLEEKVIEALVFTLSDLDGISSVRILVNGQILINLPQTNIKLPSILDRSFGINKQYEISNSKNVTKVTIYYINDDEEYVPVTKFVNDTRNKIEVIVDSLASDHIYQTNLISYLNAKATLLDYNIYKDIISLNFNENLLSNNDILEEVTYTISYSIFENYEVENLLFKVNGKEIKVININGKSKCPKRT